MKKITSFIFLLLTSALASAADNLTLSCDSKVYVRRDGADNTFEINKKNSYVFKDGYLIKGKLKIKCDWTEEEIKCHNFRDDKPSLTLMLNVDRITGSYSSSQSWWNSKGDIYSHEELSGVCVAQRIKF